MSAGGGAAYTIASGVAAPEAALSERGMRVDDELASASAAPPAATGDPPPFSLWTLLGLGALSCVTWGGAIALDFWAPPASLAPMWLWGGLHVALILAVPALILLVARPPRLSARRHPLARLIVEALLALILALAALFPIHLSVHALILDLVFLPLRTPTLSLGVALAVRDPLVIERWRRSDAHDSSAAVAAGAGFGGAAVLALTIVYSLYFVEHPQVLYCSGELSIWCGDAMGRILFAGCGGGFVLGLVGLLGALLGYAIGAWVARSDLW